MNAAAEHLAGLSILVVEDEYLLAHDLAKELGRCGATVVGPVATLAEGEALACSAKLDGAVLDVGLGNELSFGIADHLATRRIPFVFATGYAKMVIPRRYRTVSLVDKPFDPAEVVRALSAEQRSTGKPEAFWRQ